MNVYARIAVRSLGIDIVISGGARDQLKLRAIMGLRLSLRCMRPTGVTGIWLARSGAGNHEVWMSGAGRSLKP